MRLTIENGAPEKTVSFKLMQDGKDVNIEVNGSLVAWFSVGSDEKIHLTSAYINTDMREIIHVDEAGMSDESLVTQAFEQISRGIRALEGLPVEYGLARKLADVQKEISAQTSPKAIEPEPFRNSCNRHSNCANADAEAKARGAFGASHCHDDECEDCFGR